MNINSHLYDSDWDYYDSLKPYVEDDDLEEDDNEEEVDEETDSEEDEIDDEELLYLLHEASILGCTFHVLTN